MQPQQHPAVPALPLAILLTIAAGLCLSVMDAIGKHLAEGLNVVEAVWARYAGHTVVITVYLLRRSGLRFLHTRRPGLQFARAGTLFAATLLMYTSLTFVPLADATAIQFLAPVLVTLWSALFLGERIGIHRILAVVAGFAGVVIIVAPGISLANPALFLPLGVAFAVSFYFILTRMLAYPEEQDFTQFATTAVGAAVLSCALPFVWETPGLADAALMCAIGMAGALGHFLLISAFSMASASLLSPYLYAQVFGSALLSVAWFGDPLSAPMLAGTALLVGSGLYIWWRERRRPG
ncbi:DMT family transporter [Oceanicella sp. SM1341]|uniref:DMT family transporter n=1 Tax=Oceanicella sp. SM1341 TaxID=1548889 RepID=UPI0018E56B10|nr:DMT family transporter [Oceanicella sp. SM1341]